MLWKVVSVLLGIFVVAVVLNMIFGFVTGIHAIWQILAALVAVLLIILLVNHSPMGK